jgi:hypothetical protein
LLRRVIIKIAAHLVLKSRIVCKLTITNMAIVRSFESISDNLQKFHLHLVFHEVSFLPIFQPKLCVHFLSVYCLLVIMSYTRTITSVLTKLNEIFIVGLGCTVASQQIESLCFVSAVIHTSCLLRIGLLSNLSISDYHRVCSSHKNVALSILTYLKSLA